METNRIKEPHEYWYFFPCDNSPQIINEGTLPNEPYKKFDSYEECLGYCNKRKLYDIFYQVTNNKHSHLLN